MSLKLWEYVGDKVRLTLDSGKVIEGVITSWDDGYTNNVGEDTVDIGSFFYSEDQIVEIERIK